MAMFQKRVAHAFRFATCAPALLLLLLLLVEGTSPFAPIAHMAKTSNLPLRHGGNSCGCCVLRAQQSPGSCPIHTGNFGKKISRAVEVISSWANMRRRPRKLEETTLKSLSSEKSNALVSDLTMNWIEKTVVGLNLCPFAERPMKQKKLAIQIVRGCDHAAVGEAVERELYNTAHSPPGVNSLVVAPEYYPEDFEKYLAMVQFLEQRVMGAMGGMQLSCESYEVASARKLSDAVQIAPFHPLYALDGCEAETSADAPISFYVNRSPFPMFHIIQTDDIERAVRTIGGDPSTVWKRNERLLGNLERSMGRKATLGLGWEICGHPTSLDTKGEREDSDTLLQTILRQTTLEMRTYDGRGDGTASSRGTWIR